MLPKFFMIGKLIRYIFNCLHFVKFFSCFVYSFPIHILFRIKTFWLIEISVLLPSLHQQNLLSIIQHLWPHWMILCNVSWIQNNFSWNSFSRKKISWNWFHEKNTFSCAFQSHIPLSYISWKLVMGFTLNMKISRSSEE